MKYLKIIFKNPWIILLLIVFISNAYYMITEASIINAFTTGTIITTLIYTLLDKSLSHRKTFMIKKVTEMTSASKIVLIDDEGKKTIENNEEYLRGFREASQLILKDLE